MKQRLTWIDLLKGIGIFSVLLYHIPQWIWGLSSDIPMNDIIRLYFMPIFFLVSGYTCGFSIEKPIIWKKWSNWSLVIPFITCGTILSVLRRICLGKSVCITNILQNLLLSESCCGYWFLLILFFIRLIYLLTKQVLCLFHICKKNFVILLFPFIALLCTYTLQHIGVASMWRAYSAIFFYTLGMTLCVIEGKSLVVSKIIDSELFYVISFAIALTCIGYCTVYKPQLGAFSYALTQFVPTIYLYALCRYRVQNTKMLCWLAFLGENSLEIYVLHYICFLGIRPADFSKTISVYVSFPPLFQLCINITLAIAILILTLIMIRFINKQYYLRFLFFGKL